MKYIIKIAALLLVASTSTFAQIDCVPETQGYNMLLIGNSFFRPYAEKLDDLAIEAGFDNHNSTRIIRGGDNGRPINFWNDSTSPEHNQIKATLDQGNVEVFGMTAGHDPADPTEGHRAWIEYALQNNPDITIFIAIPQIDFPADWEQRAQDFGFNSIQELYDYFVNDLVNNSMVDQLRAEFPSTKIFTIPTGQTSINLDQMNENNELLDNITRFGPQETSLFTDTKGHQGDIIREAGGLLWLNSIYGVDLSTFAYETGFNTDLHAVAENVSNSHDPNYKLCFAQTNCDNPIVTSESTYEVIVEQDLTYAEGLMHDGTSPTTTAIPLLLDLYVPDNDSDNRPVFMFIHGGGFQGGTKTKPEIVAMANYFASRGWVFASIDYRTTEELGGDIFTGIAPQEWIDFTLQNASTPSDAKTSIAMYAAQRDAKAALRWIVANASTYNVNTDFITVGGASAGAISTITLGISNQEDFRDEIPIADDPTLSTTNLNETYVVRSLVDFWGSNVKLDLFGSVYGVERYDSNDPDLFIAHGTEDPAVLYSEAEELVHLYDSTGAYVELNTLVDQGHGAWNATVNGKSLSELSFDFLVAQQELNLDDCTEPPSLCDAPTNISCTAYSGNVARATWTAFTNAERYRLRYRPVGGSWTELLTAGEETFRYINGLTPNTDYQYQLKSLCASDNSVWSSTYTFTSLGSICDLTTINNHTASLNDVTLYWSADTDDVKYRVKYRPKGSSGSWLQLDNITNTQLSIAGLNANTEYKVKIKVKCEAGWTQWQSNYDFITAASLSFKQDFKNKNISLYPNPTQDVLNLEINEGALQQIQIQNINGRIYQSLFTSEKKLAVDVSMLSEGMYFVQLTFVDGTVVVRKFIR